jgi:hypothetical protein
MARLAARMIPRPGGSVAAALNLPNLGAGSQLDGSSDRNPTCPRDPPSAAGRPSRPAGRGAAQVVVPAVAPADAFDAVVVELYSNSSSAPNSPSSTFLRRPSLTASATPAPATPISRTFPKPPLRFFLGASRRAKLASLIDSAAFLISFCSFLSSKICFEGDLPLARRA